MSALAKLFPKATARPWGRSELYASEDDTSAIVHTINTYDLKDEALRRAAEVLRFTEFKTALALVEAALAVKP